jgi:hypothetical protein
MTAQSSANRRPPAPWLAAGALAAVAVGYVAALVSRTGWAPVGLASIGVGLALGLVLSALAAMTRTAGRRQLLVGTAVLALATVAATHVWLYRDFCSAWRAARIESTQLAMFRPEQPWSPAEYFARQLTPGRAVLWSVDAVLVAAAAVATVALWQRQATSVAGVERSEPPACEASGGSPSARPQPPNPVHSP